MEQRRLKKLQVSLQRPLLIKKKENLLYLTGRSFLAGYLLVKPVKYPHLTSPYSKGRNKTVPPLKLRGGQGVIFLGDGLEKMEGIHFDFLRNVGMYLGKAKVLQIEDEFTFKEYNYIRTKCSGTPRRAATRKRVKIKHIKSHVDFQREIKDDLEIAYIRKSMQIVEKVFKMVRKEIKKPGMTEIRLAEFIRSTGLRMGAQDISFPPIVASGANAAVPHHVPSSKKLKAGESIILDFGFKYKNYCSDFTRTVFLKKVPPKLEMIYNQVEKAYNESIDFINNGMPQHAATKIIDFKNVEARRGVPIKAVDVYQKSVSVLAEKHLDKYFIHSLGHGTGLEIHELPNLSPKSKDILRNGMVFSIEPGVYIPKLGGVRIEDLVYLKEGIVCKFINMPTCLLANVF